MAEAKKQPKFNLRNARAKARRKMKSAKGKVGPVGRPTKYDPELTQVVWDLLEDPTPYTRSAIALKLQISDRTADNWANEHPEFLRALNAHRQKLKVFYENSNMGSAAGRTKGNASSIQFALTNLAPDEYKKRHEFEGRIETDVVDTTDENKTLERASRMSKETRRKFLEIISKEEAGPNA